MQKIRPSVLVLCLSASQTPAAANPWAEMQSPFVLDDGSAHVIGGYSAGCLAGSVPLGLDGPGYQVMRPSRQRYFGHPLLIEFIESLGARAATWRLGVLLVGDMAQPRGGPMKSGHRSHQTGLDVDLWYWLDSTVGARRLSLEERESLGAPSVVAADGESLNPAVWRRENVELLRLAAQAPRVERIFVNPAVKRHLCRTLPAESRSWLGKLRPWWGHDHHFHVRLECPPGHPQCEAQDPVAPGPGCDETLDWWFTAEARKPPARAPGPAEPQLPDACRALQGNMPAGSERALSAETSRLGREKSGKP